MAYYYSKTVKDSFDEAVSRITRALKEEGFGILTEIDVQETLKKKLVSTCWSLCILDCFFQLVTNCLGDFS